MTVSERIRNIRKLCGLSVDEISKQLHISKATMYRYESGDIEKIPAEIIDKLSEILGASTQELLGTSEHSLDVTFDSFLHELYNISQNLSEEDKAQLLAMARYMSSKNKK